MSVFAEVGKFVGAKVAGTLITLAMIAGGWWCYQNWDKVEAFGAVIKAVLFWILLVAALPWSSFLFMKPLIAFQSNLNSEKAAAAVSIGLIGVYCLLDAFFAFQLGDWSDKGGFSWFVLILGLVAAGAYNFVICESLARNADR